LVREKSFDPLLQQWILEIRGRRWREDDLLEQEEHSIVLLAYFVQEILLMLDTVGFIDVMVQGRYTGTPAAADDTTVVFVARRPN